MRRSAARVSGNDWCASNSSGCANSGATCAIALSWLHGRRDESRHPFASLRFRSVGEEVPEFYRKLNLETGVGCPECGVPCRCAAMLFVRPLNDLARRPDL
jgi:hypothetical protein